MIHQWRNLSILILTITLCVGQSACVPMVPGGDMNDNGDMNDGGMDGGDNMDGADDMNDGGDMGDGGDDMGGGDGGTTDDPTTVDRLSFDAENGIDTDTAIIVATGDLDDDGDVDIVTASEEGASQGSLIILNNDGSGQFGTVIDTATGELIGQVADIKIADLDGDGDPDILATDSGVFDGSQLQAPGGLFLFANNGTSIAPATEAINTSMDRPGDSEIGDVDNDGNVDIVTTSVTEAGQSLDVLLGNGDLSFDAPITSDLPANSADLALADVDGDGNLDIVLSLTTDDEGNGLNQAGVLFGNGDATFGNLLRLDTSIAPTGVDVADMNGDGHLDIAVGGAVERVTLFFGDGSGSFSEALFVTDAPGNVFELVDIDQDGDTDIIGKALGANRPAVLFNDGMGGFPEIQNIPFGDTTGVSDFDIVDINGDGSPDVVAVGTLVTIDGLSVASFPTFTVLQTTGN